MPGPDLPPPHEPFTLDAFSYRWPSGAEKVEVVDGSLVFSGAFDERDAATAARAFPGRRIAVDASGCLWVHPGP